MIDAGYDDSIEISDRLEIHELIARYCWATDTGDVDLMLSLYEPNGSFSGAVGNYVGHAELRRQVEERPPERTGTQHTVTNVVLRRESDAILSFCYCLIFGPSEGGGSVARTRGMYRDRIVRFEGHWVFLNRSFERWT